jgi:hypothetical protein
MFAFRGLYYGGILMLPLGLHSIFVLEKRISVRSSFFMSVDMALLWFCYYIFTLWSIACNIRSNVRTCSSEILLTLCPVTMNTCVDDGFVLNWDH